MSMLESVEGMRLVPLGGVGEFGANATIVQTRETTILVDCGLMFPPDQRQPGVDYYVNDPERIEESFPDLSAVFLTHGHEDHIGGLGFLLRRMPVHVYTMPYTAALIRRRVQYNDIPPVKIHQVGLNKTVSYGDLEIEFIGVTHSIIQACALSIKSPFGHIIHSGDFKVDPLPGDGFPFQSERLAELGREGVDLLIMDSTNATKTGFCPPEDDIMPELESQIAGASGRVFLTTFSSHIPRVRKLIYAARRLNRKMVLIGRSFQKHFQAAQVSGYLGAEADEVIGLEQARQFSDRELLFIVTGSQAERRSALHMIGSGGFRGLRFQAGDRLIFSSKNIPGNERQIMLFASDLERQGVEVINSRGAPVHTSGHAFRDDLAYLLRLTQPRFVAPIHGEYHQLFSHHQWLRQLIADDQEVLLLEDGDVLDIAEGKVRHVGKIEVGMIPIDGNQNLPLNREILRERKDMMYNGLVLINITIPGGRKASTFEVVVHGMVEPKPGVHARAIREAVSEINYGACRDADVWADEIYRTVKQLMRRAVGGRPLLKVIINGKIKK
jgi:ribonuclease J